MKKKLEADLISIAHRILKLKNKSNLIQLHKETQNLYEKLSVLRFVEDHFSEAKPTIGLAEMEETMQIAFDGYNVVEESPMPSAKSSSEVILETAEQEKWEATPEVIEEETTLPEPIVTEADKVEETIEEIAAEESKEQEPVVVLPEKTDFEPHFELFKEEVVFDAPEARQHIKQISFEDLLGSPSEPIFERVQNVEKHNEKAIVPEEESAPEEIYPEVVFEQPEVKSESNPIAVNDSFKKIITFGLNDRIAFEKHLFGGSGEDLNRVLSQLSTFDSFQEAHDFIEDMVKPDYNNWEAKDDYAQRFMDIVEKKFA